MILELCRNSDSFNDAAKSILDKYGAKVTGGYVAALKKNLNDPSTATIYDDIDIVVSLPEEEMYLFVKELIDIINNRTVEVYNEMFQFAVDHKYSPFLQYIFSQLKSGFEARKEIVFEEHKALSPYDTGFYKSILSFDKKLENIHELSILFLDSYKFKSKVKNTSSIETYISNNYLFSQDKDEKTIEECSLMIKELIYFLINYANSLDNQWLREYILNYRLLSNFVDYKYEMYNAEYFYAPLKNITDEDIRKVLAFLDTKRPQFQSLKKMVALFYTRVLQLSTINIINVHTKTFQYIDFKSETIERKFDIVKLGRSYSKEYVQKYILSFYSEHLMNAFDFQQIETIDNKRYIGEAKQVRKRFFEYLYEIYFTFWPTYNFDLTRDSKYVSRTISETRRLLRDIQLLQNYYNNNDCKALHKVINDISHSFDFGKMVEVNFETIFAQTTNKDSFSMPMYNFIESIIDRILLHLNVCKKLQSKYNEHKNLFYIIEDSLLLRLSWYIYYIHAIASAKQVYNSVHDSDFHVSVKEDDTNTLSASVIMIKNNISVMQEFAQKINSNYISIGINLINELEIFLEHLATEKSSSSIVVFNMDNFIFPRSSLNQFYKHVIYSNMENCHEDVNISGSVTTSDVEIASIQSKYSFFGVNSISNLSLFLTKFLILFQKNMLHKKISKNVVQEIKKIFSEYLYEAIDFSDMLMKKNTTFYTNVLKKLLATDLTENNISSFYVNNSPIYMSFAKSKKLHFIDLIKNNENIFHEEFCKVVLNKEQEENSQIMKCVLDCESVIGDWEKLEDLKFNKQYAMEMQQLFAHHIQTIVNKYNNVVSKSFMDLYSEIRNSLNYARYKYDSIPNYMFRNLLFIQILQLKWFIGLTQNELDAQTRALLDIDEYARKAVKQLVLLLSSTSYATYPLTEADLRMLLTYSNNYILKALEQPRLKNEIEQLFLYIDNLILNARDILSIFAFSYANITDEHTSNAYVNDSDIIKIESQIPLTKSFLVKDFLTTVDDIVKKKHGISLEATFDNIGGHEKKCF